jgi:ADP-ribose pyrophosphatase
LNPPGSDAHLAETLVSGEPVWRGRFLDVRRDSVALPDGVHTIREYIVHPGAVMIVPLLADGRIVMERQYRHAMGHVMLEFPAGKIEAGEPPFDCALRELTEETGYRAREWARAGVLHNAIAYSTEGIEIWFARGLDAGAATLDAEEFLEVVIHSEVEIDALCGRGEITDAKTLIGLLWLQKWRRGQWPLVWQPAP